MMVLSFVWLLLVIVELVWGTTRSLGAFGTAIWIAFIIGLPPSNPFYKMYLCYATRAESVEVGCHVGSTIPHSSLVLGHMAH
jgi:hypothetical protein